MMKRILFAFFVLSMALSATAQRVYINPGHGDWGPESRNMATVTHALGDTTGFWESNTNLWKAFALQEKLVAAGYDVKMSRTENGPYPYVENDESIDKKLTEICAEVNYYGADYFISIHSNANVDGDNVNFPVFIHSGYDGGGFQDERNMALAAWPSHFEAFGKDMDHTNITHGFEPNSAYAANESNVRGSISFYGYLLGVLNHSYQGYLVEGYFHTYQPARHRALNPEWCRQEGIRYFRGIQDYYGKSGENVGYIMGCVRDISEWFSHEYYHPMLGTNDPFKPINGARVVLRDAQGNIIPTECYRHVARHMTDQYYYTTDDNYNGIFVFENLQPGTYTLTVHAAGYQDKEMQVTVTANATVYPEIFLTKGQGTEPQINVDVKWVLNGGTVDGTLPSKIEGSEYPLPTPTRPGYIFQGWYDTNNISGNKLTTLPVGYTGTVYAIWESTSVKWELNGGHVYPDNQWLWDDFQNYFNEYYGVSKALQPITNVLGFWTENFDIYWKMLVEDPKYNPSDYWWLGHYLYGAYNGANGTSENWWRTSLAHFFNNDNPKDWRAFAQTKGADSRFYTPITLPDQITSDYTIPTPEKEGYIFQGWNTQPDGKGTSLTILSTGYNGTVYAIWEKAPVTTVTWELNGGHVYHNNDWLWEDFKKTFNSVSATQFNSRPNTYEEFVSVWGDDYQTSCNILIRDYCSTDRYYWLGDYLWAKAWTASASTNENPNMSSGNEWWGKLLWACLTCTACEYTASSGKNITVDFSVAGQPKSWREYADTHKNDPKREEISPDFYNEINLPTKITTDYTIPIPEKEGVTFQGWYDNPKGEGEAIPVLKAGSVGTIYAIWQEPVPCIVAYNLNCKYLTGQMAFEFSFYANTQPTAGKLIFYNLNEEPIGEYTIPYLSQGKNTVVLKAEDILALNPDLIKGRDFLWEVHLEARPSTLFAKIFHSESFKTAYATIDNSPASDFFGSIWVASQHNHGYNNITDGEIWRLVPEQDYARDEGAFADGFEVIFRPTVAPDGKVYLTENGKSYGGVFVMDPHTKQITNFFEGCTYEYGEWKKDGQVVGSGSTGAHIYWTEDRNNKNGFHPTTSKLFLMHNDHAENAVYSHGSTKGFFVYNLMENNPSPKHTTLKHFNSEQDCKNTIITEYTNTNVSDYAIVGTSRGAWVCQLRSDKGNFFSDPSLTFYPNEGNPTIFSKSAYNGIFGDNELIHGSFGAAIAVNKEENLLAMVGGTGNIMLFDIAWSNDNTTPTLTKKGNYPVVADDPNTVGYEPTITTLNFDYAGNLVATLGETYNDARDKHKVVIFTLPKETNHINVPARFSQRVYSLVEDEQRESVAAPTTTYETVQLNRKLQSGMYNTICLPFGIDLTTLSEDHPYKNATVVEFVGTEPQNVSGEDILKLKFSQVTSMQAGVPYLIKPTKDITEPVILSGVSTGIEAVIAGKSITPAKSVVTFKGITDPTPIAKDPKILFLVANNRLATSTGGIMQGNRGYFVIDNPQNMPKRAEIAIVKGAPSSDNNIHVDDYQPTVTKVLENGVIFIIRDGVKYNLMGARIK